MDEDTNRELMLSAKPDLQDLLQRPLSEAAIEALRKLFASEEEREKRELERQRLEDAREQRRLEDAREQRQLEEAREQRRLLADYNAALIQLPCGPLRQFVVDRVRDDPDYRHWIIAANNSGELQSEIEGTT